MVIPVVCIADFGLAQRNVAFLSPSELELANYEEEFGDLSGTPGYVDPEVLKGQRPFSIQSDLFSLGCLLYNMMTGGGKKTIFLGNSADETL